MAAYIIGMQKIVALASHSLLKENELLHQGLSPMDLPSATDR
jgi:hypothetical protein